MNMTAQFLFPISMIVAFAYVALIYVTSIYSRWIATVLLIAPLIALYSLAGPKP